QPEQMGGRDVQRVSLDELAIRALGVFELALGVQALGSLEADGSWRGHEISVAAAAQRACHILRYSASRSRVKRGASRSGESSRRCRMLARSLPRRSMSPATRCAMSM